MHAGTEKILQVEGMTCTNCALGVQRIIEKNGGENCVVNFSTGEAKYTLQEENNQGIIVSGINKGGYKVIDEPNKSKYSTVEKLFVFCLIFTLPLFGHMFVGHDSILNNPIFQFCLTIPVLLSGGLFFTKSAFNSIKNGVPNMDVLVTIGIWSAFIYSTWGILSHWGLPNMHDYLFFETTATVTTLVLLGNVIENRSVRQTTTAIKDLQNLRPESAKKITSTGIEEVKIIELNIGDNVQINQGDRIPLDGKVMEGELSIDESMISGESEPVYKKTGDVVIGGTIILEGNGTMSCKSAVGHTTLDKIIQLVKSAQESKPNIQKMGDQVSAIFVPIVLGIALLTFLLSLFLFKLGIERSTMQSIAVLVISCPCAMGLAAPTAIMVGIGKAAKQGILIKGGQSLEKLAKGEKVVFDKTGTITTGEFVIDSLVCNQEESLVKSYILTLTSASSHPISKSLSKILDHENVSAARLSDVNEMKGIGMEGKTESGNTITLVSSKHLKSTSDYTGQADLILLEENKILAELQISDAIKPGVKEAIQWLKHNGVEPVMLSGDKEKKCSSVAKEVGIDHFYFEKNPHEKLALIESFNKEKKTIMVGDGINDAPALAKSYVGISFGGATGAAINSAEVVLLNNSFSSLIKSIQIGKQTYRTIKQNFFWAFFYNAIAIPFAAFGFLRPIIAALSMAFSDVIVIGNSIMLRFKR